MSKTQKEVTVTFYHDEVTNECQYSGKDYKIYHVNNDNSEQALLRAEIKQLKERIKTLTSNNSRKRVTSPGIRVNTGDIARPYRLEIQKDVKEMDRAPLLVGILANEDPAAKKYAEWIEKSCNADGINYELRPCLRSSVKEELKKANNDPQVDGILVFYPVFGDVPSFSGFTLDDDIRNSISISKDVEGLGYIYRNNLYQDVRYMDSERNKKCIVPCTPLAIVKIIEHQGFYDRSKPVGKQLCGKTITVVNRSNIVGRPLAAMLQHDGADVYSVDIDSIYFLRGSECQASKTSNREAYKQSDIIVTGVPSKNFRVPLDCISEGTTMINVSGVRNVDVEEFLEIPGTKYISSVGKVTVAMLERNLVRLVKNYR